MILMEAHTRTMHNSHSVEFSINWCNYFNIVTADSGSQMRIRDGPVLLNLVKLLKLSVEPLEEEGGGR